MKKIALVTGASSGIGKETTVLLSNKNYKVYAVARNVEKLKEIESENIVPLQMDVTDSKSIDIVLNLILKNDSKLDLLVNNAGFGKYGAIEEMEVADARLIFETNVFGLMDLTKMSLPLLKESKSARIINISSISGKYSNPFGGWYCASKFALEALSDALRIELSLFNIKVILVEPGQTNTNFGEIAFEEFKKEKIPAYTKAKNKYVKFLYSRFKTSTPAIKVAEKILLAATKRNPKARYTITFFDKMFTILIKLLPDRLKDLFSKRIILK